VIHVVRRYLTSGGRPHRPIGRPVGAGVRGLRGLQSLQPLTRQSEQLGDKIWQPWCWTT
jgi:hypothetical protein